MTSVAFGASPDLRTELLRSQARVAAHTDAAGKKLIEYVANRRQAAQRASAEAREARAEPQSRPTAPEPQAPSAAAATSESIDVYV
jgi:hypothetical protein